MGTYRVRATDLYAGPVGAPGMLGTVTGALDRRGAVVVWDDDHPDVAVRNQNHRATFGRPWMPFVLAEQFEVISGE